MVQSKAGKPGRLKVNLNRFQTFISKPYNFILIVLGILLTITTFVPIISIFKDTVSIHVGSIDQHLSGKSSGYTLVNWIDLFTGRLAKQNLWRPLSNSFFLAVLTCVISLLYGGIFAYMVTRTDMKYKKYLSTIFIFPYIMPQWTLAVVWQRLFNSNVVTGGSDGLLAALFGVVMPEWFCRGLIPSAIVLGLHYAPFAYIMIGGILRNMDANLEEAALILKASKMQIFFRITLPMIKPGVLSTILLVFGSAMGSYPVPHYLNLTTLSTRYVGMNVNRAGQASILAIIMMLFGILILLMNQRATGGRQDYTTVTGKSGQISKINLSKVGKYGIAFLFIFLTAMTSIYPIISFALETFLPNPGDYSFLRTFDTGQLTTKWWAATSGSDGGMYGQAGILHNRMIGNAFKGQVLVAVACALIAGTIGTLVGYSVSKKRRSGWAKYVNAIAFLPYLMPALAVGVAFFIFGSEIGIYNTYLLCILAGTMKYIPFASRSSYNSMLQLGGEIEEAAIIQGIPWHKRMLQIIIPIQKSSILSGYFLPFITGMRELTLFMLLVSQNKLVTTLLDYYDEMGLYAFSSGINLMLIVFIILAYVLMNKLTGASLDEGLGQ